MSSSFIDSFSSTGNASARVSAARIEDIRRFSRFQLKAVKLSKNDPSLSCTLFASTRRWKWAAKGGERREGRNYQECPPCQFSWGLCSFSVKRKTGLIKCFIKIRYSSAFLPLKRLKIIWIFEETTVSFTRMLPIHGSSVSGAFNDNTTNMKLPFRSTCFKVEKWSFKRTLWLHSSCPELCFLSCFTDMLSVKSKSSSCARRNNWNSWPHSSLCLSTFVE